MRVAIAVDHAGFPLKNVILPLLQQGGHDVIDCGTSSEDSVDYPVYAARAAQLVSSGEADRAVLACGSGSGVNIVANKFTGVRALNARDPEDAEMGRRHNDINVLTLAGRRLDGDEVRGIVETFLDTEFEGGRHQRRVDQITGIEGGQLPPESEAKLERSS
jgi:ribose 5-phosphate isomerase B